MHVLITGASSGIGEALAREYLKRNADITVVARRKDRLDDLCAGARTATLVIAKDLARGPTGDDPCAAVIAEASRIGYREIRLDTLPTMTGALALYRAAGFQPMQAYYATPVAGTIFLRRPLSPGIA